MKTPTTAWRYRASTPLGPMWLAATDAGLAGAWFHDQRHAPPADALARWPDAPQHPVLRAAATWLDAYFQGATLAWTAPLDLRLGTPFQQTVWGALCTIAPGTTVSYSDIARRIDRPRAVRAVGAAVGANPLGIIVPCHRVMGASGALTGYAGGLHRKAALLDLEAAPRRLL